MRNITLLAGIAAALAGGIPTAGYSQVAGEAVEASVNSGGLEEVVVTARRKEEPAQSVPLTITAISADTLERQDLRTITDLSRSVPGLAICCSRGIAEYPFIRGVPGVKGYFAETPAVLDGNAFFFDVDNVQVLKGPQGTLFGVATNGGAILYEPIRPSDQYNGYLSGVIGDYSRTGIEGAVNVPISDSVQLRASMIWNKSDGYQKDLSNGKYYGDEDYWGARLSVNIAPSDFFSNYFVVNYYDSKGTRPIWVPTAANEPFWQAVNADFYESELAPFMEEQARHDGYHLVGPLGKQSVNQEMLNVVDQATFHINDDLAVRNIIGYSSTLNFQRLDVDGTPFAIYDNNVSPTKEPDANEMVSEELQVQGNAFDNHLEYTVGSFNQWYEVGASHGTALADLSDVFGILLGTSIKSSKTTTNALYAEGTYDLSSWIDGLKVTAGYRYTRDKVELQQTNTVWVRLDDGSLLDLSSIGAVPASVYDLSDTFKKGTYRFGLQYQPTDRTLLYFTNSKGYSAGGFNLNNPRGSEEYQPESLNNFELGVKSDWQAGHLQGRTNLSVYFGKYDDIQVSTTLKTCTDPSDQSTCTFGVGINNAAEGEIKGAEFEFALVPSEWFELGGNSSWMDAEYTDYEFDPDGTGPLPPEDRSGQPFLYIPKFKYSVFASVGLPIGSEQGSLRLGADYSWQDDVVTTATPDPQYYDRTPSYGTLNINLTWTDTLGVDRLTSTLFVTNVADNETADGQFGAYNSLGLWGPSVAVPRQVALRLRYSF